MSKINILLTHRDADEFETFSHGESEFVFTKIRSHGPSHILDGSIWIFIDWVLDDMAGLELCRRMRADTKTASAHITMILEDGNIANRKRALDAGADDYVVGPIDRRGVLDRILALNPSMTTQYVSDNLEFGPLRINLSSYRTFWGDDPIDVTPDQIRLLRFLAENANRTLTREEIIIGLGKSEEQIDERTVDVWVKRLRKAISSAGGGNPFRTVRSKGYVFEI